MRGVLSAASELLRAGHVSRLCPHRIERKSCLSDYASDRLLHRTWIRGVGVAQARRAIDPVISTSFAPRGLRARRGRGHDIPGYEGLASSLDRAIVHAANSGSAAEWPATPGLRPAEAGATHVRLPPLLSARSFDEISWQETGCATVTRLRRAVASPLASSRRGSRPPPRARIPQWGTARLPLPSRGARRSP